MKEKSMMARTTLLQAQSTPSAGTPSGRRGTISSTAADGLTGLRRLTLIAFLCMAVGFLAGEIEGVVKLGVVFVPPLVVGSLSLVAAGLIATRIRWLVPVATAFAIAMLLGAVTLGSAAVWMRLTNTADLAALIETWIQIPSTLVAAIAGLGATIQVFRPRGSQDR